MFCPECKGEFVPGVTRCNTCGVALVESLPGADPQPPSHPSHAPSASLSERESRPVTVLSTGDPGLIALAKSLLQAEDVPYMTRGEGIQDLYGLGRLGGYNVIFGAVQLQVRAVDVDRAHAILDGIDASEPVDLDGEWDGGGDQGAGDAEQNGAEDDAGGASAEEVDEGV